VTFDFEPTGGVDEEYVPTQRGADERLESATRTRAAERLAAKRARRQEVSGAESGEWRDISRHSAGNAPLNEDET